jgi:hypothetical protein
MVSEVSIRTLPHAVAIRVWYDFFGAMLTGLIFSPILLFWGKVFSKNGLSYTDAAVYSIAASVWDIVYNYGSFVYDLDRYGPHTRDYYVSHVGIGAGELLFFVICLLYPYVIFMLYYRNVGRRYVPSAISAGCFLIVNVIVNLCVVALVYA